MTDRAQIEVSGGHSDGVDRLLDNPVWSALSGPQAKFAERAGRAARYRADVSVFAGLDDDPDAAAWADAARLPGSDMVLVGPQAPPPSDWAIQARVTGLQMLAQCVEAVAEPEAVPLGRGDVGDMLALISRTRPGPFLAGTIELGHYLGIRRDGVLVAMAGERVRLPGWTEVSAVCTDQALRGSGLASRLERAVVAGIEARGDRALLHVAATNASAISLYRTLGFVERREIDFVLVRPPADAPRPVARSG